MSIAEAPSSYIPDEHRIRGLEAEHGPEVRLSNDECSPIELLRRAVEDATARVEAKKTPQPPIYTGGSVDYYKVPITNPTSGKVPYLAECNDIIEALGMNYAEGNAFKALWRKAAAKTLGIQKKGYDAGLYDAEKVVFFGSRLVIQAQIDKEKLNGR